MGVIYKLKQEVIDYILELKKLDGNLSCRKIAELASSRFQKEISKSSVNAILKDSSLSSPIGRRGKEKIKEEKFRIPDHRKEQIFINIPAAILEPQLSAKPSSGPLVRPVVDKAGLFFLKAAEWQIKRQGVLRFLCEKYGSDPQEEKVLRLAQSFLYLPVFGVNDEKSFLSFNEKAFWELNDLDTIPTTYQKAESFETLKGLENKNNQIALDLGQVFTEASFFQVVLEDGTNFCIDCQNNSSWDENNVHCGFSSCLDKSFDFLSRNIINNTAPVVLRQAANEGNFSQSFLNMVAAFENIPGKRIKRVDLMTHQKEIISSFDHPLHKKRGFVVGLYECGALAQKVLGDRRQPSKTFHSLADGRSYDYAMATTAFRLSSGEQITATIVFLNKEKDQAPQFGILTNMMTPQHPIDEILQLFLQRWPAPLEGHRYFKEYQQNDSVKSLGILSFLDEKIEDLSCQKLFAENSILSCHANILLLRIHDYARRHFFPHECAQISFADAVKKFYGLAGEVVREKDLLKIKLVQPPEASASQVNFIIKRINEGAVVDPQGRRIVLS